MAPHVGRIVKNIEGQIQTHTAPEHYAYPTPQRMTGGTFIKRKRRLNRTKKYRR
jgi:hypothetical protein